MSHHGVVPGAAESIPQLRIIPEFRKGRQSLLNMMAVAGGRGVHYHAIDHIVFPIGSQGMKYLFQADLTGGQVTAALFNRRQKLLKRHFLFFRPYNSGKQNTSIAGLAAVSVDFFFRLPAFSIRMEALPYPLSHFPVALLFLYISQDTCNPGQGYGLLIKSAGGNKRGGSIFIQLSPFPHLGISLQNTVHGPAFQMIHIALHQSEILAEDIHIPILLVIIPGCHHTGAAPVGIFKQSADTEKFRRDSRNKSRILCLFVLEFIKGKARIFPAVRLHRYSLCILRSYLGIPHVSHNLGYPAADIITCCHRRKHQLSSFQPSQLFNLRTVCKAAHHIAFNGTIGYPVNLI